MTKSCVVASQQVNKKSRCFLNLHDFLKTKRAIVKCAKKTLLNNNGNDDVKNNYGRFGNFNVEEFEGSYWIGDRLFRKSGSGLIFLAKNKSALNLPTEIVVKSCLMEFSSSLQHEKEVVCNLGGPWSKNVVRCYGDEITRTKSGEKIYNVLFEYCSGSSLRDHIIKFGPNGLAEYEVRKYTRDIVHGLYYLHCDAHHIHGDIKPKNILLIPSSSSACAADQDNSGSLEAKLASFGLAKKLTPEVLCDEEISGSGPYISPELARDGYLDWPADIWALGCVVLEMLTGKPVWSFENAYRYAIMDSYNNDELPEIPKEISSAGRDFVKRCLIRSPYKRRPTWLLINHPFVCL